VSTTPVARHVREARIYPAQYFYWVGIFVPFSSWWSVGNTEILPQRLAMLDGGFQILSINYGDTGAQKLLAILIQGPNPEYERVKSVALEDVIQEWRKHGIDEKKSLKCAKDLSDSKSCLS
jgi:hypothetical protein